MPDLHPQPPTPAFYRHHHQHPPAPILLAQADEYEARYNFRFEEPGAAQIITYPRKVGLTSSRAGVWLGVLWCAP